MDLWKDQWVKMEARVAIETRRAYEAVQRPAGAAKTRFSQDYLEGLADGLQRALLLIEAFRKRAPKTELEAKVRDIDEMYEFSFDEEW